MNSRQSGVSRMPCRLGGARAAVLQGQGQASQIQFKKKIKIKESKLVWDVLLFVKTMWIDGKPSFLQV